MRLAFESPLNLDELESTLESMKLGKTIGLDGVIMEFYIHCWDFVHYRHLKVAKEALECGSFPKSFNACFIKLIYKGSLK